jgi:hypothetical protein
MKKSKATATTKASIRYNAKIQPFIQSVKLSKKDLSGKAARDISVLPTNLVIIFEAILARQRVLENAVSELVCEVEMMQVIFDNHLENMRKHKRILWL